ncbi:MAG: hypothetical protein RIC14_00195 [Filomicrobium sp.]
MGETTQPNEWHESLIRLIDRAGQKYSPEFISDLLELEAKRVKAKEANKNGSAG